MISLILFHHMVAPHIVARVASFANGTMVINTFDDERHETNQYTLN